MILTRITVSPQLTEQAAKNLFRWLAYAPGWRLARHRTDHKPPTIIHIRSGLKVEAVWERPYWWWLGRPRVYVGGINIFRDQYSHDFLYNTIVDLYHQLHTQRDQDIFNRKVVVNNEIDLARSIRERLARGPT